MELSYVYYNMRDRPQRMHFNLEHEILEPHCSEPGGRVTCHCVSLNSGRPPGFLLVDQERNPSAFKPSYIYYLTAFC
jgi:hypothetical protein